MEKLIMVALKFKANLRSSMSGLLTSSVGVMWFDGLRGLALRGKRGSDSMKARASQISNQLLGIDFYNHLFPVRPVCWLLKEQANSYVFDGLLCGACYGLMCQFVNVIVWITYAAFDIFKTLLGWWLVIIQKGTRRYQQRSRASWRNFAHYSLLCF